MAPHIIDEPMHFGGMMESPATVSLFPHHQLLLALAQSKQSEFKPRIGDLNALLNTSVKVKKVEEEVIEEHDEVDSIVEEEEEEETRKIKSVKVSVTKESNGTRQLSILLRFEDGMNRQMQCPIDDNETADDLAEDLLSHGLINKLDRDLVAKKIDERMI